MLKLEKKSIAQAIFVIGYEKDLSIRKKQFEIEKFFQPLIPTASSNTNLPDDFNSQAPRVILSYGAVSAHFSQVSAQMAIDVNNEHTTQDMDIAKQIIADAVMLFQQCLDEVIDRDNQLEQGLVLTIKYPVDMSAYKDEDIFRYIQSNFITLPALGAPASAGLNVGYKTDDNYFINLGISQYKIVFAQLSPAQEALGLDFSNFPAQEIGIELKIDVNSKPQLNEQRKIKGVTAILLKKAFDFLYNDADNLMGIKL